MLHFSHAGSFYLWNLQVLEVLDEEVLEEAQCEGLAPGDCIQQGQECVRVAVLQHRGPGCRGGLKSVTLGLWQVRLLLRRTIEYNFFRCWGCNRATELMSTWLSLSLFALVVVVVCMVLHLLKLLKSLTKHNNVEFCIV
jgi:hypothetical protein